MNCIICCARYISTLSFFLGILLDFGALFCLKIIQQKFNYDKKFNKKLQNDTTRKIAKNRTKSTLFEILQNDKKHPLLNS